MKKCFLLLCATLLAMGVEAQTDNAAAGKKEIIKTGYNFGPLPVVAFDADKGVQLGGVLNIYDFHDGSAYPNTRQQWYLEASFFTKGSQQYVISYDNKFWIPGVRFSTALNIMNDTAMDFYGFNGYESFYDFEKVKAGKENDDMYIYTPKYRMDRLAVMFKSDFIGKIGKSNFSWEAGYHLSYLKQGAVDRKKINKNKDENEKFPDSEPTLFEQYRQWGIIKDDEADGGWNSTLRLGMLYDSRDKEGVPTRGIWAETHLILAPKWLGTTNPYYKYSATFRHYVPILDQNRLTFAYRLNYEGTFGNEAPYYVLPFLTTMGTMYDRDGMGGFRTVRGIMRNRVQGFDMASYNAEFRWHFTNFVLWKQNIALGLNLFSDGTMVTKDYDMSFGRTVGEFKTTAEYEQVKGEYDAYMAQGLSGDRPHIAVGAGFRFIMNQNFIVCFEYGKPIGKYSKQDGNGAFYINTGYLF